MNKESILNFVAAMLLIFAFRALADCSDGSCSPRKTTRQTTNSSTIDCQECCKGNFTSEECLKNCGSCMLYSDKAYAEERDFPSND